MAEPPTPREPREAPEGASPRSTAAHVMGFVGGRVVAAAISACTGLILPRMLGVEDAAAYGVAVGIAMMLVVITDLGCTTSLSRFLADGAVSRETMWRAVSIRYAIAAAAALVLIAIGALGQAGAISLGSMRPHYLQLAGVLCLASSLPAMASGLLPALRRVPALLLITIAQPLLELAGIIAIVVFGGGGGHVMVASSFAALIVGVAGMGIAMRAAGRGAAKQSGSGEQVPLAAVLGYGIPMFVVAICFTIFGQIDQMLLYWFSGPTEAAPYIWNWRLIALINLPTLAVATIIAPRIRTPGSASGRDLYFGWLRVLCVVSAGLAGISVFLAPWLVSVALGREKYGASWSVFVALGVYTFLLGIAPLVTMAANFLGGARRRVGIGIVTVGANVVLDLLLIPSFGAYGAAAATTVAFGWFVGAHVRLTSRLITVDVTNADRVAERPFRVAMFALVVALLVGVCGTVAHLLARYVGGLTHAPYSDLVALAAGGITGFTMFLLAAWKVLLLFGVDLRRDLRREAHAALQESESTELEGAA